MAAGGIGGNGASVGSSVGGGTADRLLSTDSSGNLATDADTRFDGTNVALGGAIVSGRRLQIHQENSGVGIACRAAAANYDGNVVAESSDSRLLLMRQYGTSAAGTDGGLAIASRGFLQAVNTSGLLIGGSDVRTAVYRGASGAAFIGGTMKTFQADVAHDGTGTDVFYTYSIPAASMAVDGDHVKFEYNATFAANANNKTIIVAYGGTTMYTSGTVAKNGGSIRVKGTIWRTGAATQRWSIEVVDDASTTRFPTVSAYGTAAETLSGAVAIEFRGTAGAASDIVAKTGVVQMFPAGN